MTKVPFVSICMITYNHEEYICEAIEGVLKQKTNFHFELIISDDCSSDNTRDIVKAYFIKYPNIIKLDYPQENRGVNVNFYNCLSISKGKYVALCEGDDCWTDSYKLQKQVDFLEANPEYSMCFHNAEVKYEYDNKSNHPFTKLRNGEYTGLDIYKQWLVPTASVVMKSNVVLSERYRQIVHNKNFMWGDLPLFLTCAEFGKLYAFSDIMSVYRRQAGSTSHNKPKNYYLRNAIHQYEIFNVFGSDYKNVALNNSIASYLKYSVILLKAKKISAALKSALISIKLSLLISIKQAYIIAKRNIL